MKKAVFVFLVPAVLLMAVGAATGERQYKRWRLDFERGTLDFVTVKDSLGASKLCWYLTYKVTNNMEQDVPLGIALSAKTDTKKKYLDSLEPEAQALLEKKTGKKYKNSIDMFTGTLAQGKSLDAVAFFGELDPNFDDLHIHVAGLYDTVEQVEGKLFFEKKVLVLHYNRPGDEFESSGDEITFKGKKWIIEGERRSIPQR